ncbi:MAG: antibiotic biosynthesis monooxygenase, partial [Pseudomonadota bacterium]
MLMVIGTAKLGEGAIDAGREALEAMITASRAEEGCIDYTYSIDILDPSIMRRLKMRDESRLIDPFLG